MQKNTQIPIVFVHGRNAGPGVWAKMMDDFRRSGFESDHLFAWSYNTSSSTNEVLAQKFSAYIDTILLQTGATHVNIVAHSLGSLPTRWYIKYGGGLSKVRNWISIAGPNHGTAAAWFCVLWDQGCRDMSPNSYVIRKLNEGEEAPGPVRYTTFWSPYDVQISPPWSTALRGATNIEIARWSHNAMVRDGFISERILEIFRRD